MNLNGSINLPGFLTLAWQCYNTRSGESAKLSVSHTV